MAAKNPAPKPKRKYVKKPGAKIGRPRVEIDMAMLAKLCEVHCSLEEVAGFFECETRTIERRVKEATGDTFVAFSAAHRGRGRTMLRRVQYQKALKGDSKMLIWMGKQHLEQSDRASIKNTIAIDDIREVANDLGAIVREHVTDEAILKKIEIAWIKRLYPNGIDA